MIFDRWRNTEPRQMVPETKKYIIPWADGVIDPGFKKLVSYREYINNRMIAPLGYNSAGEMVYINISKAPHILTAGSTGSGKSVCINTILQSLLLKNDPGKLQLYFADIKKVDYIEYADIPHTKKYVSDIPEIAEMLGTIKNIMQYRFSEMQKYKVKNVIDLPEEYPQIIIIFDEYASISGAAARRDIYPLIEDIARLGRAAGIHILLGIQRADRQVISGQLKANIPTRICFRVPSAIDSRVILDRSGGESLTGAGDGLLLSGAGDFGRFSGYMVPEDQSNYLLDYWRKQN